MKTICVLLSGTLSNPVGGHKVLYHYANALSEAGHKVLIVNNIFRPSNLPWCVESARKIYSYFRNVVRKITQSNTCRRWYKLNAGVKEMQVWTYDRKYMPMADYYVATNVLTSPFLLDYNVPDNHKFYFIQGYENWLVTEDFLIQTFHYPFQKIVVAGWLKRKLAEIGEDAILISNGFDQERFNLTIPIAKKDRMNVSILYHEMPEKNFSMGLDALVIVRSKYPQLRASVYGVYSRPAFLPEWCDYFRSPSGPEHNRINNEAAIYLGTSSTEGFSLTILEAMACGQAVVCTDIDGYKEVADNDNTALISPVNDANAMATNILRLIEDDELRTRIAIAGHERIKRYSMATSCQKFVDLF